MAGRDYEAHDCEQRGGTEDGRDLPPRHRMRNGIDRATAAKHGGHGHVDVQRRRAGQERRQPGILETSTVAGEVVFENPEHTGTHNDQGSCKDAVSAAEERRHAALTIDVVRTAVAN